MYLSIQRFSSYVYIGQIYISLQQRNTLFNKTMRMQNVHDTAHKL
jgi:hypothetical protein